MHTTSCLSLVLLLFFVAVASPQQTSTQETEKGVHDAVAQRVEKDIRDKDKIKIDDLKVLHENGTIYLYGVCDVFGSYYEAEKEAKEVEGVKNVINEIGVRENKVADSEIQAEAIRKIRSHLKGTPFDLVSVKVNNGFVTLIGNVRDTSLVEDTMESVMWIRGVRGVTNKIQLASISSTDERLRQAIFRRLYNEFPQYFIGKDPSVLILVNNGRVGLVGFVESNVSKEKIGSMVRSFPGVLSVENLLQSN